MKNEDVVRSEAVTLSLEGRTIKSATFEPPLDDRASFLSLELDDGRLIGIYGAWRRDGDADVDVDEVED